MSIRNLISSIKFKKPFNVPINEVRALQKIEPQTSNVNHMKIVSNDLGGPISRLSLSFLAGSRFETDENKGITHILRRMTGLHSKLGTYFLNMQRMQQIGTMIQCTGDRELISFEMTCRREVLCESMCGLMNVATQPVFRQWQLNDYRYLIEEDGKIDDRMRSIELVHKVAFRSGLGNSLFCPLYNIDAVCNSDQLQSYYETFMIPNRCTLAGLNINHEELCLFAQEIHFDKNNFVQTKLSRFHGGEIRLATNKNQICHVAIVTEGSLLCCRKNSVAFAILQYAWQIALNPPKISCNVINICYSDIGLFGLHLSGNPKYVCRILPKLIEFFKSAEISEQFIELAKLKLIATIRFSLESEQRLLQELAGQVLFLGKLVDVDDLIEDILAVPVESVRLVAKHVASGKLAMSAVGDVDNVPYVDDF